MDMLTPFFLALAIALVLFFTLPRKPAAKLIPIRIREREQTRRRPLR
ncbi:hypothetical protein [Craterilacuibacter sp. RT1T]|nr:hypothetical protein [Craterilacuibacter sp. RT1T]MCL6263079.1 hypothetical protein [Craterilacuibacter sp. RT1T]